MAKESPLTLSPNKPDKPPKTIEADTADAGESSPERKQKKAETSKIQTTQSQVQSQEQSQEQPQGQTKEQQQESQKKKEEKKKNKLVELCEVLNKSLLSKYKKEMGDAQWAYVEGAADNSSDKKNLPQAAKREKEEGDFRQYINLKKDIEDKDVHPEFGRMIIFKARVEWEDKNQKESIAGKKIYWGYERGYNTEKKKKEDREPDENEQLIGLSGPDKPQGDSSKTVQWFGPSSVDEHGWTSTVVFKVSQIEGDKFKIYAQADVDDSNKPGGDKKETKFYVVGKLNMKIEEICEVLPKETLKKYYKKKGKEAETPDWGCVEGAADKSQDTKAMPCDGKREKEDSEDFFRQYINLNNDIDENKVHPEYGRTLRFKAKVRLEHEKYKDIPLKDKNVYWGFEYKYEDRPKDTNEIKGSYKSKSNQTTNVTLNVPKTLGDSEKEKFDGLVGPVAFDEDSSGSDDKKDAESKKKNCKQWFGPVKTDKSGWTKDAVKFIFSQYGGDQFKIFAKADVDDSGKPGGDPKETEFYTVWRKFWYQPSHYSGFTSLPDLSQAQSAYKAVKAVMSKSSLLEKKSYTKNNLDTKGVKRITIYKQNQIKFDNNNKEVVIIGTGNEKKIREFLNDGINNADAAAEPTKIHVMYCDYQCDPEDKSIYPRFNSRIISFSELNKYTGGLVLNPPVKPGVDVFEDISWHLVSLSKSSVFFKKLLFKSNENIAASTKVTGFIHSGVEADITVNETSIEIAVPDKFKKYFAGSGKLKRSDKAIYLEAKVNYGEEFLGDSDGHHVIIVVKENDDTETSATVAHEIGHSFNQTPRPANKPASLPVHPMGHSDAGYHCYYKAKATTNDDGDTYKDGICVMAQNSGNSTPDYCPICKPYVKLQNMTSTKNPSR